MHNDGQAAVADRRRSVAAIYESGAVAGSYLEKRMRFSWQRVLHERQVAVLNAAVSAHRPAHVLEVAPGPARLSVELKGITRGTMVENSAEMIAIARERLRSHGLEHLWTIEQGDAFDLGASLGDTRFDFAYTFRLIRHFREQERARLYAQLHGQLAPGGLLMFDVVNATVRARIDAAAPKPADELPVYDADYSEQSFIDEMARNGFEVLSMTPVIRHFMVQAALSHKLDHRLPGLAPHLVRAVERIPSTQPLEWVALMRKK
jgi:SAM-dependent methyltransferase